MRRFKSGEQICTSFQIQIEPDKDDKNEDEEIDFTDNNEDCVHLQNYLSIICKLMPQILIDTKKCKLLANMKK